MPCVRRTEPQKARSALILAYYRQQTGTPSRATHDRAFYSHEATRSSSSQEPWESALRPALYLIIDVTILE